MSPVNKKYLTIVSKESFSPYAVRITESVLNIRNGPGKNYSVVGQIRDRGIYTIVKESLGQGATKWGYLKSGAGWISLDGTVKYQATDN